MSKYRKQKGYTDCYSNVLIQLSLNKCNIKFKQQFGLYLCRFICNKGSDLMDMYEKRKMR